MLPDENTLPKRTYEAKKVMCVPWESSTRRYMLVPMIVYCIVMLIRI
ncbi:unnamed protein product [Rhodiola kirilowii]